MRSYPAIAAAASLLIASMSPAPAAADDPVEECILDGTFQCLDATEPFWDCYDWIVQSCQGQVYPSKAGMPKPTITALKRKTRAQAQSILQQHMSRKRR